MAIKIAGIILVFLLLFRFVFGLTRLPDESMSPALRSGDLLIYYRMDHNVKSGEIVPLLDEERCTLRRVMAVAGDVVDLTDEGLSINGALYPELPLKTFRYAQGPSFPLKVPEGEIFVLADQRENARDSRVYGTVPLERVLGKIIFLFRNKNF